MKVILYFWLLTLFACGKNFIDVSIKPPLKHNYYLTTQESLIDDYSVIQIVDLRNLVKDLDSRPIEYETFEFIHHSLNLYAAKTGFNRAVLVKGDDCSVPIGYCFAYLIFKPKAH